MDLSTVIGLVAGVTFLIIGDLLEGGNPLHLLSVPPFFIVIGGTTGALMVSFTLAEITAIPRHFADACQLNKSSTDDLIEVFAKLSEVARKEGLLSLESIIEQEIGDKFDPMLKKGIRMVVDGTDLELVRNMFETEIYIHEQQQKQRLLSLMQLVDIALQWVY